jgi:ferredoxin
MYAVQYGKTALARQKYAGFDRTQCTGCGQCEAACPYSVAIRDELIAADRILSV